MFNVIQKIKSMKACKRRQARRKIVVASLFTGGVTALLTFFTSKKNGEQNRKDAISKSQKIAAKLKTVAGQTNSKIQLTAGEMAHKAQEVSGDLRQKAMEARDNLSSRFNHAIAEGADKVAQTAHSAENSARKLEDKADKNQIEKNR